MLKTWEHTIHILTLAHMPGISTSVTHQNCTSHNMHSVAYFETWGELGEKQGLTVLSNWPSTLYANQTFFKLLGTLLPQPPEVLDLQSCATKPIQEIIVLAEYLKCEHQTQVHSM